MTSVFILIGLCAVGYLLLLVLGLCLSAVQSDEMVRPNLRRPRRKRAGDSSILGPSRRSRARLARRHAPT